MPAEEVGYQSLEHCRSPQSSPGHFEGTPLEGGRTDQQFAVPVEPPFRAVRVQQVGKVPLAFPLALVVASETGRVNALPRGLHLDVSGDGTSHAHPVIRANLALCV